MLRTSVVYILLVAVSHSCLAQELHTDFRVIARANNKNFIGWNNPYKGVIQINIQRSYDSVRNFKTILTVPDPKAVENGFVDAKSPIPYPYYRILILMEGGKYLFSVAKRPEPDPNMGSAQKTDKTNSNVDISPSKKELPRSDASSAIHLPEQTVEKRVFIKVHSELAGSIPQSYLKRFRDSLILYTKDTMVFRGSDTLEIKPYLPTEPPRFITIKKRNKVVMALPQLQLKRFRDSIALYTKDTLQAISSDTIIIKPFVPQVSVSPSSNIYTDKEGNVIVSLDDAPQKNYAIKFFGKNDAPLFSVGRVKEKKLRIDKSNFLESGWYWFELYENEIAIERNKFFIPRYLP